MPEDKNNRAEIFRKAGPYLGLGTMFLASIGTGIAGGYWADRWLGTTPWLTLAGSFLGIALGFYNFFVVVLRRPPQ